MRKRIISLFLTLVMILGMFPAGAFASDVDALDTETTQVESTAAPTAEPTAAPTAEPTPAPTAEPTPAPTAEPTPAPTAEPTPAPTAEPTPTPTVEPTPTPTAEPTPTPTAEPSVEPTPEVTVEPDDENDKDGAVCICGDKCAQNAVDQLCPVCLEDYSVCIGKEEEGQQPDMTAEELAELFKKLPSVEIFESYVSRAEVEVIEADLIAAVDAYDDMCEDFPEEARRFEELYLDLLTNAFAINDRIYGSEGIVYADGVGFYYPYETTDGRDFTITLGNAFDDVPPQVVRYVNGVAYNYEVVDAGNRKYKFRDTTDDGQYIITATAPGYAAQQYLVNTNDRDRSYDLGNPRSRSGSGTLKPYYIYTNSIPSPYTSGSTEISNYGPSSDNTPMVTVTIDLAKLSKNPNVVFYQASSYSWYFAPHFAADGSVSVEQVRLFWDAVLSCLTESGRQEILETGLYEIFKAYKLQYHSDGIHADGILDVEMDSNESLYVAELNVDDTYFSSIVSLEGDPKYLHDVLALCDQKLGGTVYWESQSLERSVGYYYDGSRVYEVTVKQTDKGTLEQGPGNPENGTILQFVKKSTKHYLATFNMTMQDVTSKYFKKVTFTDGVADEVLFPDMSYPVQIGHVIPNYSVPERTGYVLKGWKCVTEVDNSESLEPGKSTMPETDLVFEADWQVQTFTVTWKNPDDDNPETNEVLETDTVDYGTTPVYNGATPSKAADAQYNYEFTGWTPAIGPVTSNVTYTAQYEKFVNEYTVRWLDENGTVLELDHNVPYGTTPEYNGNTPSKAADAQYTYSFSGWTPEISTVTGNIDYKAVYTATTNKYTVTWYDDNKTTVLETDEDVEYGATPAYNGETPQKAPTAEYSYTFKEWTPAISAVTGDAAYYASYTQTRNAYTVTWLNHDDTQLDTDSVEYGAMPVYTGAVPTKAGDAQYSYVFSGWSPEIVAVTSNATYKAQFEQQTNKYTVTWNYAINKQEVDSNIAYGTKLSFSDTSNLNYEAGNYRYELIGWTLSGETKVYTQAEVDEMTVTGDMTLTAVYNSVLKGHPVTVSVVLDAVLENGSMSGGKLVTIEQMMGEGTKLYIKGEETEAYELFYDSATQSYKAPLVPNGEYSIYSNKDDVTPLSPYHIVVDNAAAPRPIYFYSVGYDLNGGSINGSTDKVVEYHRNSVDVMETVPVREGYTFLGWQLEDGTVKQAGENLSNSIDKPYKLKAVWGNALVNLTVIIDRKYLDKGQDTAEERELEIALSYRRNESESYVEHVGTDPVNKTVQFGAETTITNTYNNVYTGLDNAYQYSLNVFMSGYEIVAREVEHLANGVNNVTVYLQYRPHTFNLQYTTEVVAGTDKSLIPSATDVKVYSSTGSQWKPITAHVNSSTDVLFNIADTQGVLRHGSGSYEVPVHLAEGETLYYRVAASGFTLSDGTELNTSITMGEDGKWSFSSDLLDGKYPAGAYTAELQLGDVDKIGVFGHETNGAGTPQQQGTLKILVKAHPAKLVFNMNDGTGDVYKTLKNVFAVPGLEAYTPTRLGYSFRGWYKDAECKEPAAAGELLTPGGEQQLYAKWSADITIEGTVYVSTINENNGKPHPVHTTGRLGHVTVRVLNQQGLPVKFATADIIYSDDTAEYGSAAYSITGIPDDGSSYTISVIQGGTNYSVVYQNEPASVESATDFGSYNASMNAALTNGDTTATVNAYLKFTPHNFDFTYKIDATAIGEGFRPDKSKTLVLYDADNSDAIKWAVIGQMNTNNTEDPTDDKGQENTLENGQCTSSYPVWQYNANGSLYNYAVKLQELQYYPMGNGKTEIVTDFSAELPFTVSYEPLYTYFVPETNAQKDLLTVKLSPRSYPISYVVNGGTMPASYETEHVWSKETKLNAQPTRAGYEFGGWYTDTNFTEEIKTIPAATAEASTVYAKWTAVAYTISYNLDGGTAEGNPTSYTVDTETFVLNAPTKEGHSFLGWTGSNSDIPEKTVAITKGSTGNKSYTAHWELNKYNITVTVTNGTADCDSPISVNHGEDKTIKFTPKPLHTLGTVKVDGEYVVLDANSSYTFNDITADHSIEVIYLYDFNGGNLEGGGGDLIPDEYQAWVTYKVINGSLAEGVSATHCFNLKEYKNGQWVDTPHVLGDTIPTVADNELVPAVGYDKTGLWLEGITAETPVYRTVTYTWEFTAKLIYTVIYPDADREPNANGIYPESITNRVPHGSYITVVPNGGVWTTDIFGQQESFTAARTFPLESNINLGTPVRENYVFKGWKHTVGSGNVAHVYTAQWAPKQYKITYVMPNSFIDAPNPTSYTVESASITLNNPYRPGYDFVGWSGTGLESPSTKLVIPTGSSGDREYTANWTARTDTQYHIRYYLQSLDGTSYEELVDMSKTLTGTTGAVVSVEESDILDFEGFTFNQAKSGTSGTILGSGDMVLNLLYDRNKYTVTWVNEGTTVETDTDVPYGAMPEYNGQQPSKAAGAQYTYTFDGWTPAVSEVTGDVTYTAKYKETVNQYTVTWLDYDNQILRKDVLDYGAMPVYGEDPKRESGAVYSYEFAGWTPTITTVSCDASYKAEYTPHLRYHNATVSFFVDDVAATKEQIEASIGDKALFAKADNSTVPYPLTAGEGSNAGVYQTQLPVGNYKIYFKNATEDVAISDLYLSVIDRAANLDLHYYSVTYKSEHGEWQSNVEYYPKGSHVNVGEALAEEHWYFKGWQLANSSTVYNPGDLLSAAIDKPYVLNALWSNVMLNLTVEIRHTNANDSSATDPNEEGTLKIDIAYRYPGQDSYLEVSDIDDRTETVTYDKTNGVTEVSFKPMYTGLKDGLQYSANAILPGYTVVNKTAVFNEQANAYDVKVVLQYDPNMFTLTYETEAKAMVDELVPLATDVKIYSHKTVNGTTGWHPITAHENYSVDVPFKAVSGGGDIKASGSGSYGVPVNLNADTKLYYRVGAVGWALKDGTELNTSITMGEDGKWTFSSDALDGKYPAGAYTGKLEYTPAANDTANGAYGVEANGKYVQQGSLKIVVQAHPATLNLHMNDADVGASETVDTINNIFVVPDLSLYVPVRPGYTFLGWYTDKDCEEEHKAASGTVLGAASTNDYYAKWAPNLTVCGNVVASNKYGEDLLLEGERLKTVTITLHRADQNQNEQVGVPVKVNLTAGTDANTGAYQFENVPNDGSSYFITVTAPGYAVLFDHEVLDNVYSADENTALDIAVENAETSVSEKDNKAHVDVKLNFAPTDFELKWEIHAEKLGAAFRPQNPVPVYVMADINYSEGYNWAVIAQMREGAVEAIGKAQSTEINAETGIGSASFKVWKFNTLGHAYNYAIRIASMVIDLNGDGKIDVIDHNDNGIIEEGDYSETLTAKSNENYSDIYPNLPFIVQYHYPAFYMPSTDKQDTVLTATLIPNTYTVTLDPNGGQLTMADGTSNPLTHTWSHETNASFQLSRPGYVFEGWVDESGNEVTYADATSIRIAAAEQRNITLTAQWTAVQKLYFTAEDVYSVYNGREQLFVNGEDTDAVAADAETAEPQPLYDGLVNIRTKLPEGYSYSGISYKVSGTNVGEYPGKFTSTSENVHIFNEDGVDVTEYYMVDDDSFIPGKLIIEPETVIVTAKSASKVYDGKVYEDETKKFVCTIEGLVNEENIEIGYRGNAVTALDVGSYTIEPVVTNAESYPNYYFITRNETLTITPKTLTADFVAFDGKDYDQSFDAQGNVTLNGVVDGDMVSAVAYSILFDSNQVQYDGGAVAAHTVTATNIELTGDDRFNYVLAEDCKTLFGSAKIYPVELTVTLVAENREYDKTNLVNLSLGSWTEPLHGDDVYLDQILATGTVEDVNAGNDKAVTAIAPVLAGAQAHNYVLKCNVGTVDILPRTVKISSASAEKTYDGEALTAPEVTIDEGSFVEGDIENLSAVGSHIGKIDETTSVDNTISYVMAEDVKNNYNITETLGTLTVRADENQNQTPDEEENKYTVTYLKSPEHTDLEADKVYAGQLNGMAIPPAPAVQPDTGYRLNGWKLIGEGVEGANNTIGTTDLVYELVVLPCEYTITYKLETDAVNDAANPDSYIYTEGVNSFGPASRPGFVFMGWYEEQSFATAISSVSETRHGDITIYPKWEKDELVDPKQNDPDPNSPGDGVPDIYQVIITYKVENGTWADGTKADKEHVMTRAKLQNGVWTTIQAKLGDTVPEGMLHDVGYDSTVPGTWDTAIDKDTPVPDVNTTYTFSFGTKYSYNVTVTVTGGSAKCGTVDYTAPVVVQYGDTPSFSFTPDTGLVLDKAQLRGASAADGAWTNITLDADGGYTLAPVTENMQLNVVFSADLWDEEDDKLDEPDGIADSHQVAFIFRAADSNGTVEGETVQVYTLDADANGQYRASIAPETVTAKANTGYKLKNWTHAGSVCADPFAAINVVGGNSYIFEANFETDNKNVEFLNSEKQKDNEPQSDTVTVQSGKKILVDPNGGSWKGSKDAQLVTVSADTELGLPVRDGYIFLGWLCKDAPAGAGYVRSFTAQWAVDAQGDGIPDKYQKKVVFRIVNGVWGNGYLRTVLGLGLSNEDIVLYLTLTDEEGNYSETGTAELKPYIPTNMRANRGYYKGRWDVRPPDVVSGTNTEIYIYSFIPVQGFYAPRTGDDSNMGPWLGMMLMSLAGALGTLRITTRKKKSK